MTVPSLPDIATTNTRVRVGLASKSFVAPLTWKCVMSETGSEPGETPPAPPPAAGHPAGRAEIIRRSLEAMNEDNIRQIRNVYVPGDVGPEANGTAATEAPPDATADQDPKP
jgi:hypothetical protein